MSSWSVVGIMLSILLMGCSTPTPAISPTAAPNSQVSSSTNLGQKLPISAQAVIGRNVIELEVAQTPQQQAIGLMHRTAIPENRGMLFLFDSPQPVSFWMKNVRVPLDMIFMKDGVVKGISAAVPPCTTNPCPTYGPRTEINQVIELRGGRASQLGLKVNDKVNIKFLNFQQSRP